MGIEIERKWLVPATEDLRLRDYFSMAIVQGYISYTPAVRVRYTTDMVTGELKGYITIKGKASIDGTTRSEYEYEIPYPDAWRMMEMYCQDAIIVKSRYCIPYGELTIELDVFRNKLEGLVIAEIELPSADYIIDVPAWFGKEVTQDHCYSNLFLALHGAPA